MLQIPPNFLTLPLHTLDENDLQQSLKLRLIKQIAVSQILFIYSVWKQCCGGNKIGILGCGIMGKLVLNTLLPYIKKQKINPSDIHVSTRRPENLNYYEQQGIQVYFDNDLLISQCDFVIISIPPTLDNWNILELKYTREIKEQQKNIYFVNGFQFKRREAAKTPVNRTLYTLHQYRSIDCEKSIKLGTGSYVQLIQEQLAGIKDNERIFQTQALENITQLIIEESFKNYCSQQDYFKFKLLNQSLSCYRGENIYISEEKGLIDQLNCDEIALAITGRKLEEIQNDIKEKGTLELSLYLNKILKMSFQKRIFEYQNLQK